MTGIFSMLEGSGNLSTKRARVIIAPISEDGTLDESIGTRILQYWPDSVDDSDNGNWQSDQIPGLPRPIYQWVSGSERIISFTAVFSRDMDGTIPDEVEESDSNVDVDAAITWLRILKMHDYQDVGGMGKFAVPPPTIWLCFQGMPLGNATRSNDWAGSSDSSSSLYSDKGVYCLMQNCSVAYHDWFPSGRTKYAEASLSFSETIQYGNNVNVYGRSEMLDAMSKYNLTIK